MFARFRTGGGSWTNSVGLMSPPSVRSRVIPPMDAGCYEQVLVHLAGSCVLDSDDVYSQPELRLRRDFFKNKCVWVGEFWEDMWYFLININPVLAMCYSHPLHPISRGERFMVNGLSFFFVGIVAVACAQGYECTVCDVCLDCHIDGCYSYNVTCIRDFERVTNRTLPSESWASSFCCQAERWGVLLIQRTFDFGHIQLGAFMYAFLANCVFHTVCFQLMMCGCVQQQSKRARKFGERVGYVLFALIALGTLLMSRRWFTWVVAVGHLPSATVTFLTAKLTSWLGTSILNIVAFVVFFKIQRPKDLQSRWRWMDPPLARAETDRRSAIARALNPRFNVLAAEYIRYAASKDCGELIGSATS